MLEDIIIEIDNAPDTKVKASFTEGWGLFADKDFKKGEIIMDFNPFLEHWYKLKYKDLSEEQIRKNWYVMIDEEWCMTCDKWSKFSYINHSRKPNCLWLVSERIIKADKDITKGDELFVDYRLEPRPSRTEYPKWI